MKGKVSIFTLFLIFMMVSSLFATDHFIESFENPDTWSSYTTGTVTFDSGAWEFVSVYPEASTASYDGVKACRINDDVAGASITAPAVNTVGTISFYYHRPFSGTGSFVLQKSTDGGTTFVDLDTVNFDNVTTPTFYSYNVNDMSSSVIMKIVNDDNTAHLTIDYVTITDFGGVANPVADISLSANAATETAQTVITVTANTDMAVTGDQTLDVAVTGAGIDANDYVLSNTVITIADGTTSGSVTFTVVDDTVFEGNETATIAISNPSAGLSLGSTLSDDVVITDNETPSLPLTEDFESNTLGVFTAYSSASNRDWGPASYSGNYYAYVNGYGGDEDSNDWLIAPALDLTSATAPQITFDNAKNYTGPDLELVVSTDYDGTSDPATQGTWTPLTFNMSTGSWAWVSSGAIDLTPYISSATYIGFHYITDASGSSGWEVDNIVINEATTTTPEVTLSLSANSGTEEDQTLITVTADADAAVSGDQTVDVAVTGTGIDGNDYVLSNTTITIADGMTSGDVTLTISDDSDIEGTETATITISNPSAGITLGTTVSGDVIIADNDTAPAGYPLSEDFESNTLGVFTAYSAASNTDWGAASYNNNYYAKMSGFNGDEDSNDWLITPALDLTSATAPQITFDNSMNYTGPALELKVSTDYDGTSDPTTQGTWTTLTYTMSSGSYTWVASGNIDLTSYISANTYVAFHYTSDATGSATWQIDNVVIDEAPQVPVVTLSLSDNAGFEADQTVITVTAVADAAVSGAQTVDVAVTGTGIDGNDYVLSGTTITIADGTTTGSVTFTISDDADYEGTETATITISNPSAGIVLGSTVTDDIAITDDDPFIATLPLSEDFETNTLGVFTAHSAASNKDWEPYTYSGNVFARISGFQGDEDSNDWLISPSLDLSAAAAPYIMFDNAVNYTGPALELKVSTDYDGTSDPTTQGTWTSLTFTLSSGGYSWAASGTVDLSSYISTATYVAFQYTSDASGAATWEIDNIVIDDMGNLPVVELSIDTNTGFENVGTVVTCTATASDAVSGAQTVAIDFSGTNIDANDGTFSNATITIADGATTGSVTYTILDDSDFEGTEYAVLTISNPSAGISIGNTDNQTVTIVDDESTAIPYTETFENDDFGYWRSYSVVGNQYWYVASSGAESSSHSAGMNGYSGGTQLNEDWLISPPIDFNASSNEELQFYTSWNYGNSDATDYLKVMYSTDFSVEMNPSAATWTELTFDFAASSNTWQQTTAIDISTIGGTGFIAFKYRSEAAARSWLIDNIELREQVIIPTPNPVNNLAYGNETQSDVNITWNQPTGVHNTDWSGVVVFVSDNQFENILTNNSMDNSAYSNNLAYGTVTSQMQADDAGNYGYCVYNGNTDDAGNITVTGLNGNTTYYVAAYAYYENGTTDSWSSLSNIAFTTTGVADIANFNVQYITYDHISFTWDAMTSESVVIVASENGAITSVPTVDPATLSAGSNVFGNGTELNTGEFVVYKGAANQATITLTSLNDYYFKAYTYIGTSWGNGFESNPSSVTPEPQPVTNVTAQGADSEVALTWTNNPASSVGWWDGGVVVVMNAAMAVDITKSDLNGSGYGSSDFSVNDDLYTNHGIGTQAGNIVVYKGTAETAIITGLTNWTNYHFAIFTNDGTSLSPSYWSDVEVAQATPEVPGSDLAAGDIAITGYNADTYDDFSFVLLEDVLPNTVIKFTDDGWTTAEAFRGSEDVVIWNSGTTSLPAGTHIRVYEDTSNNPLTTFGTVSGSLPALSSSGDQLIAYQGDHTSPVLLGALHMNGGWDAEASSSNTSILPAALTEGFHAMAIDPEVDNAMYNMSVVTGTKEQLLAAIYNPANWLTDNSTAFTLPPTGAFVLAGMNTYAKAKVFLSGTYNTSTSMMNDNLNQFGYLPLQSPYIDSLTITTMPDSIVDWVYVELRDQVDNIVEGKSMLLRIDGHIVDGDYSGDDTINYMKFNADAGDYYLVVHHRNHIGIMSSTTIATVTAPGSASLYDFTTSSASAYTSGPAAMSEIETGVWGLTSGDVNHDGSILVSDATMWQEAFSAGTADGYHNADINMDGSVIASDNTMWVNTFQSGAADCQIPAAEGDQWMPSED